MNVMDMMDRLTPHPAPLPIGFRSRRGEGEKFVFHLCPSVAKDFSSASFRRREGADGFDGGRNWNFRRLRPPAPGIGSLQLVAGGR